MLCMNPHFYCYIFSTYFCAIGFCWYWFSTQFCVQLGCCWYWFSISCFIFHDDFFLCENIRLNLLCCRWNTWKFTSVHESIFDEGEEKHRLFFIIGEKNTVSGVSHLLRWAHPLQFTRISLRRGYYPTTYRGQSRWLPSASFSTYAPRAPLWGVWEVF